MPYDKKKRKIMVGDVLKIYSHTGARNKKYYMYKQVVDTYRNSMGTEFLKINHLVNTDSHFFLVNDDRVMDTYEIVQGYENIVLPDGRTKQISFEERPKLKTLN